MTRRPSGAWWIVAAVLVAVAAGALGVGQPGGTDASTARTAVSPGPATSAMVARSEPVSLTIPAIRVSVPLVGLGLNPDGTVEVPTDFDEAGWYRLGPTPGQRGSAVILGHVDSYRGEAVFFRLKLLRPGDLVDVGLANGATVRFAVTYVATYPKPQFPAAFVYGDHGISALQLVTCGGEFDTHARSYLSNVVVYTRLAAGPAV
jgi:sortase (surface protein transpeptidase)